MGSPSQCIHSALTEQEIWTWPEGENKEMIRQLRWMDGYLGVCVDSTLVLSN